MVIKINTTEEIGKIFLAVIGMIEVIAEGYRPENLQFKILDEDPAPRAMAARTQYKALLPTAADGTFDMAKVEETVRVNLESVGAHTLNGIVYQDIVAATLEGRMETEPAIRARRMMKPGSSQGAVQKLRKMGFIESEEIKFGAASGEGA